jgi:hypothetical protein
MRKINLENEDDVVNVHPDMKNLLSHRVFPLPSRILGYLWDYGSLSERSEVNYIESMIRKLKLPGKFERCLARSIEQSQNYIKKIVEERQSSVSLRDIKRVIKIFHFYACYVEFRSKKENYRKQLLEETTDLNKTNEENELTEIKENKEPGEETKKKNKKPQVKNYFANRYKDFDEFCENKQGFNHQNMEEKTFEIVFSNTLILNYIFRIADEGRSI